MTVVFYSPTLSTRLARLEPCKMLCKMPRCRGPGLRSRLRAEPLLRAVATLDRPDISLVLGSLRTPFRVEPRRWRRPGTTCVLSISRPGQTPPYASATGRSPRKLRQLVRIDRVYVGLAGVEASLPCSLLSSWQHRRIARGSAPEAVSDWIERARGPATVCAWGRSRRATSRRGTCSGNCVRVGSSPRRRSRSPGGRCSGWHSSTGMTGIVVI